MTTAVQRGGSCVVPPVSLLRAVVWFGWPLWFARGVWSAMPRQRQKVAVEGRFRAQDAGVSRASTHCCGNLGALYTYITPRHGTPLTTEPPFLSPPPTSTAPGRRPGGQVHAVDHPRRPPHERRPAAVGPAVGGGHGGHRGVVPAGHRPERDRLPGLRLPHRGQPPLVPVPGGGGVVQLLLLLRGANDRLLGGVFLGGQLFLGGLRDQERRHGDGDGVGGVLVVLPQGPAPREGGPAPGDPWVLRVSENKGGGYILYFVCILYMYVHILRETGGRPAISFFFHHPLRS